MASKILTLVTAAQHQGLQQIDVTNYVKGMTASSTSRHVMDWSELDKNRKPGMDFIQQRPDPEYRRRNLLFLTPKGKQFLDRVAAKVNKALAKP